MYILKKEGRTGFSVTYQSLWLSWLERGTQEKNSYPQVSGSIPADTRKLESIWIWDNRPSSKKSKLLFPFMKSTQNQIIAYDSWRSGIMMKRMFQHMDVPTKDPHQAPLYCLTASYRDKVIHPSRVNPSRIWKTLLKISCIVTNLKNAIR